MPFLALIAQIGAAFSPLFVDAHNFEGLGIGDRWHYGYASVTANQKIMIEYKEDSAGVYEDEGSRQDIEAFCIHVFCGHGRVTHA